MVLRRKTEVDMRASQWLLGLATAGAVVGMIGSGCGGSSTNNGPADSGPDVTQDQGAPETGMPEAAPEAAPMDAGATCAVDADLTMLQNVADAEIGDSSATDLTCYTCMQATCAAQLATCNANCTCKTDILTFLGCIGAGSPILSCGGGLITDTTALPLIGCLAGSSSGFPGATGPGCLKECGVNTDGGPTMGDGGAGDGSAGDGSADAAKD
jgi:hypothetical protein